MSHHDSNPSKTKIEPLNSTNYRAWADEMRDWLQVQGLWRIVAGTSTKPTPAQEVDQPGITERWEINILKAVGAIRSCVSAELKVHTRAAKDDPVKLWTDLQTLFVQQKAAPRFNAYHELLQMKKKDDESLDSMVSRIDKQMSVVKSLAPSVTIH
jgi:gag-polypeptide of LTR copia-type